LSTRRPATPNDHGALSGDGVIVVNLLLAALVAVVPSARANAQRPATSPDSFLHDLVRDARAKIDAAIVARPPKLVPPQKVALHWKLVKLGSLDLGAPLVALAGADLDGDGKGELYAVTTRDVIALALHGKKLEEIGRVALSGELATPAPRDVVATAIVDGSELVASVSSYANSVRVSRHGKTLAATPGAPGFTLCAGEVAQLAPGRNYFADNRFIARCRTNLVDPEGRAIRARGDLALTSKLDIAIERCAAAGVGCQPLAHHEYGSVGIAFEFADLDRDGKPEVIYSADGAPGDPDILKVVTIGDDDRKWKLRKSFTAGGIPGIGVADLDGNGVPEAIAAVRLVGATRVDFWRVE